MAVIPVAGVRINQIQDTFGAPRSGGRRHHGIDIFAKTGTPVLAAMSGTVIKAQPRDSGLGGRTVTVRGADGRIYYYAHMHSVNIRQGARVKAGQQLGTVGATGNARGTPPHLHFSIGRNRADDGAFNAMNFLRGAESSSGGVPASGGGGFDPSAQMADQEHQNRILQFLDMLTRQQQMRNRPIPTSSAVQVDQAQFDPAPFQARLRGLQGQTDLTPMVASQRVDREAMLGGFERMARQSVPQQVDEQSTFRQRLSG